MGADLQGYLIKGVRYRMTGVQMRDQIDLPFSDGAVIVGCKKVEMPHRSRSDFFKLAPFIVKDKVGFDLRLYDIKQNNDSFIPAQADVALNMCMFQLGRCRNHNRPGIAGIFLFEITRAMTKIQNY